MSVTAPMALEFEWSPTSSVSPLQGTPLPRWGHTAVQVQEEVLFIGGAREFNGALAEVWAFSEKSGWAPSPTTGCPLLSAHSADLVGGHIYCFGGDGRQESVDTWILDTNSMAWAVLGVSSGCAPQWRRTAASVVVDDSIYIIGGWGHGGPLNDVHVLQPTGEQGCWSALQFPARQQLPSQRANHSATAIGATGEERIVVYGGFNGRQLADVWILETRLHEAAWSCPATSGTAPPEGRSGHTASAVGNQLVLLGGEREERRAFFHDVHVLNCDTLAWGTVNVSGAAPLPRGWHSATLLRDRTGNDVVGSRILVFGGGKYTQFFDDAHILDVAAGGLMPVPPDSLAADFGRLLSRADLADVNFSFECGGELLRAHSQVLCVRSMVFDAMLADRSKWAEGQREAIEIDDIPADSFRVFLQFLYTGSCSFDGPGDGRRSRQEGGDEAQMYVLDDDVQCALDLLPLASMHMLPRLQAQCVNVLSRAVRQRAAGLGPGSPTLRQLLGMSKLYNLSLLTKVVQAAVDEPL